MHNRAMTLENTITLLEQQEQLLHYIYTLAPLPEPLRKRVRDHAGQTQLLAGRVTEYLERKNGVVRAKNIGA